MRGSGFRGDDNVAFRQIRRALGIKKVNGCVHAYQHEEAREHGTGDFVEVEGIHG